MKHLLELLEHTDLKTFMSELRVAWEKAKKRGQTAVDFRTSLLEKFDENPTYAAPRGATRAKIEEAIKSRRNTIYVSCSRLGPEFKTGLNSHKKIKDKSHIEMARLKHIQQSADKIRLHLKEIDRLLCDINDKCRGL